MPFAAYAHGGQKVYRVGYIVQDGPDFWKPDLNNPRVRAFYSGLRDLGYAENHNLVLKRRSAEGKGLTRTAEIGAELISEGIDLIIVNAGSMAKELMGVTSTVPILMAASVDPVAQGIVSNLARPGGNVTGFSVQAGPEFDTKRLEFLKELVPGLSRVAFLGLRGDWENTNAAAVRAAAEAMGVGLFLAEHSRTNYDDAFDLLAKERPDGLIVALQPASYHNRLIIIEFVLRQRIPTIYPDPQHVLDGGLMCYAVDYTELSAQVAGYADKILRGAKPGDLPVQQPTKFELVINTTAAKVLGLTIPASLLARADKVIE
jgi:putative ABC transport system substrate-binding protein